MDRNEEEMVTNDSDPLLKRENEEAESSSQLTPPKPATLSALEIEDEETDGSSAGCCRICLETDSELGDELISPCMCKGTQQFVHRSCLDHWRSVKEGFAFSHCTTCKAQFHLRVETWEDNSWRKMKFRIFVARDVILVFLAVQLTIAMIGAISNFLDRDGSFRNSFSDGWDRFLSKHPIPFYYCIGVVVFFVLLGFFGLILHCSSFNDNQDPCLAGCRNCCYGWGVLDCLPASLEACFALVVVFVVVFAILGIAYGVVVFFVLLGFFGLILHCSSFNDNQDPCLAGCRNCCYGWGVLDCLPASLEACFALVVVFVVVFAILGIAYGFLAATMAVQRIWQRHYHILTKRELTKEYVVEDLHGSYTPPKLDPEHEERLKMLKLL
ncbi:hypothetical protein OsJ_27153 [Oryza sativa Japonica Group]|uniref:RING-CH-type domain-containing protein n=1 Tax=Oryza sativa subsp. japonica TaxID=39947 RepID=B9G0P7_ORYSJ|nr:hypothetical protein OsJ_27153 [Oryza sativa Japonica Group]